MGRKIRPYKRKKGSPKQKKELNSFNLFTDELVAAYFNNTYNSKEIPNNNRKINKSNS